MNTPLCFHDLAKINKLATYRNDAGELIAYTRADGSYMRESEVQELINNNRDLLDRWYLEVARIDREQLKPRETLPDWLLRAEHAAWNRKQYKDSA